MNSSRSSQRLANEVYMNGEVPRVDWKDQRFILRVLALVLISAIVIVALVRERIVANPQWTVQVVGRGTVEYQPDEAVINMGVQVDRVGTADGALEQLNTKVNAVLNAIKEAGIEQDAITTQTYSLYPEYDYINERRVLAGYTATQQVEVKIKSLTKDTERLSSVISTATKAGVNQINGINFDIANADELKDKARIEAIADARSKATTVADAAGVRLDKVVGWWENFIQTPASEFYIDGKGGGLGGGEPSVPSGRQEIVVEINLSYLVK